MPTHTSRRSDRLTQDRVLADGFRASCAALAALFALFAAWHAVEFTPDVAAVMVPMALLVSALAGGTSLALGRRAMPPGWAHPLAAVLVLTAHANTVVNFLLTGNAQLATNVLLLIVAAGVCLVDPRWVAGLTAVMALTWVPVAVLVGVPGGLSRTTSNLIIAALLAVVANLVRRRTLDRLLAAQARLRELSERCELTGLLNRRGFLGAARSQLRTGRPATVWFIDVDELKVVNDRRGHEAGDALLLEVARALDDVFAGAVVARLSGDEFAVLDHDVSPERLADQQRRLEDRLALTSTGMGDQPVRVSTGTATARAGQDLSEVLSAADAAMYEVKAARRATRAQQRPVREPDEGRDDAMV